MSIRVTLLNTFAQGGGAAIACQRLQKSLQNTVHFSWLSINKSSLFPKYSWLGKLGIEKWSLSKNLKNASLKFHFDTNQFGLSLSNREESKQADILHFHWINQGLVSMNELQQLFDLNKPIVWTLHDMWAFTGGCHYSGNCTHYKNGCGNCPWLKNPSKDDLSFQHLLRKKNIFAKRKPYIVTCSNWLAKCAGESAALANCTIRVIPNPIDIETFSPKEKLSLRKKLELPTDKKLLLFSSARLDDPRKGVEYLIQALQQLHKTNPALSDTTELVLMGSMKGELPTLPFKVHKTGFISGDGSLAEYYAACDVFVLPSVEDNLPNTVMESISCGTPAVAFNIGGLADLIDHKLNGYLAYEKDSQDLATGILYVLENQENFSVLCRQKAENTFSETVVAKQYLDVYQSLIV